MTATDNKGIASVLHPWVLFGMRYELRRFSWTLDAPMFRFFSFMPFLFDPHSLFSSDYSSRDHDPPDSEILVISLGRISHYAYL